MIEVLFRRVDGRLACSPTRECEGCACLCLRGDVDPEVGAVAVHAAEVR